MIIIIISLNWICNNIISIQKQNSILCIIHRYDIVDIYQEIDIALEAYHNSKLLIRILIKTIFRLDGSNIYQYNLSIF